MLSGRAAAAPRQARPGQASRAPHPAFAAGTSPLIAHDLPLPQALSALSGIGTVVYITLYILYALCQWQCCRELSDFWRVHISGVRPAPGAARPEHVQIDTSQPQRQSRRHLSDGQRAAPPLRPERNAPLAQPERRRCCRQAIQVEGNQSILGNATLDEIVAFHDAPI